MKTTAMICVVLFFTLGFLGACSTPGNDMSINHPHKDVHEGSFDGLQQPPLAPK